VQNPGDNNLFDKLPITIIYNNLYPRIPISTISIYNARIKNKYLAKKFPRELSSYFLRKNNIYYSYVFLNHIKYIHVF
jgi:hypothetical protein